MHDLKHKHQLMISAYLDIFEFEMHFNLGGVDHASPFESGLQQNLIFRGIFFRVA